MLSNLLDLRLPQYLTQTEVATQTATTTLVEPKLVLLTRTHTAFLTHTTTHTHTQTGFLPQPVYVTETVNQYVTVCPEAPKSGYLPPV